MSNQILPFFPSLLGSSGKSVYAIQSIVGAVCYVSILALLRTNAKVTDAHKVKENLVALLGQLGEAEAGQRGFTITGEPEFKQPYDAACVEIERIKEILNGQITDPDQKQNWRDLQAPIAAEIKH